MKFLFLVLGIILFCAGGAWFTTTGDWSSLCLVAAGLAVVAGEGFKIAMAKQLEEDLLAKEEKELEDGLSPNKPS